MEITENLKRIHTHTHKLYRYTACIYDKNCDISEGQIKELQNMQTINKFIPHRKTNKNNTELCDKQCKCDA